MMRVAATTSTRRAASVMALAAMLLMAATADAAPAVLPEYQLKAALLVKFARFVRWPVTEDPARAVLKICVVGEDPFGRYLDDAARATVAGRRIEVRRAVAAPDAAGCDVAFISTSERRDFEPVLAAVGAHAVLTVSDIEDFAAAGGIIGLVTRGGRIRFEVNRGAADAAGVRINAQLLDVASRVFEGPQGRAP